MSLFKDGEIRPAEEGCERKLKYTKNLYFLHLFFYIYLFASFKSLFPNAPIILLCLRPTGVTVELSSLYCTSRKLLTVGVTAPVASCSHTEALSLVAMVMQHGVTA